MAIEIPNARFSPCMDSFLGSWSGLLKSLEDELPIQNLWGLSGLGFKTQIHRALLPEGLLPLKWDETCSAMVMATGYACAVGLRDAFYTADDLRQIRLAWMRTIEKALDDGRAAISFGMHGPAFGIIYGFDDQTEAYRVSTFIDGQTDAPIDAMELGSESPPLIFVLIPTGPLTDYDANQAARQSIKLALDQHLGLERDASGNRIETPPDRVSGLAAYNAWSAAIETERIEQHWTLSYYAAYYAEARSAAALWLKELSDRPEWSCEASFFKRAAEHLAHEGECFGSLSRLFPMQQAETLRNAGLRTDASACIRLARSEHIAAMETLLHTISK